MEKHIVTASFSRWRNDLREMLFGLGRDPLGKKPGRRWDRDFLGEIGPKDVHHAIFLVVISLIPASIVAYVSPEVRIKVMAQFFGAPVQAIISGFLTSVLIFLGSHLNRVPKPYPVAFKLMLRIMSVHPLLAFLMVFRWGGPLALLIYGFFVIRGVRRVYVISLQNTILFFGVIYFVFALLQTQTILSPPMDRPNYIGAPEAN